MPESVEDLIRDLVGNLSAVADEFRQRADRIVAGEPRGSEEMEGVQADLCEHAREVLRQRRARTQYFSTDLFHEPAWDMLVALFVARCEGRTMNVKALVGCSDAPATTSQRWIEHLSRLRMIERVVDYQDRRRVEISLSHAGLEAMTRYLELIAQGRPI